MVSESRVSIIERLIAILRSYAGDSNDAKKELAKKILIELCPRWYSDNKEFQISVSPDGKILVRLGNEEIYLEPEFAVQLFEAAILVCELAAEMRDLPWREAWSEILNRTSQNSSKSNNIPVIEDILEVEIP